VFVTQDAGHNYSKAEEFGPVVIVTDRELVPWAGSVSNRRVITQMFDAMRDYRPGVDYILPSGSPLAIVIVAHMVAGRGEQHHYLKWDSRANEYYKFTVDGSELGLS
jgi:hypothetical protein